jgi:hypothetical protein
MAITEAALLAALQACVAAHPIAAEAPPQRVVRHAIVESKLEQFAVGVNEDRRRHLPGDSRTFTTLAAARAFAQRMLDQGRSLDIGLMQVNLKAHPNAFRTWSEAFSVQANVCAGARILGENYVRVINSRAACFYHTGSNPNCGAYAGLVDNARVHFVRAPTLTPVPAHHAPALTRGRSGRDFVYGR